MGLSRQVNSYFKQIGQRIKARSGYWKRLFAIYILASFLYIFMEWLFFVTMPSFMSQMSFPMKVQTFLISGLALALFSLVFFIAFIIIDFLAMLNRPARFTLYLGAITPALILSSLALLLIDNFTYTVFKFGISTSTGIWRAGYAGLFIVLLGLISYRVLKILGQPGNPTASGRSTRRWLILPLGLLLVSLALTIARLDFKNIFSVDLANGTLKGVQLPNIIMLGSDGLNAENLSAYGYSRNTTPQLSSLAQTSLVAENAFTNAGNSAGSVVSIFTGKLPTQTRVLYPPDILTGINSFQHLPGILHSQGYTTIEYGVPYYIDAYSYNLQDGFDIANNRRMSVGKFIDLGRRLGFDNEVYLLSRLTWRISDRILHIFYVQTMPNPYELVTQPSRNTSDQDKIDQLLAKVEQTEAPVFIHAHLLGTHGGLYGPTDQLFSLGKSQNREWMVDFYDDTLRTFDAYVGHVIYQLKQMGEYDNTILIIYTDHNQQFKVNGRIPLIIHFPCDQYAGTISQNVQNLDIAPTILDYLGLSQPSWMMGESLIEGNLKEDRLIYSMGTNEVKQNEDDVNFLDPASDKPPFYQFSYINIVDCQVWYSFDLNTFDWTSGIVKGYVDPCNADELRSTDEIKQAMKERLASDGFDISSLP